MKISSLIWVVVGLLISPGMVIAGAYKWQDSLGRTNYGNEPPENISDFSEVPIYECLTEECKTEQAAQSAEQEKLYKELRERQIEQDKLKVQQTLKSGPVYVPMVVHTPFPIPYGGTVFTGSVNGRKRHHPKPELIPHGVSSESRNHKGGHSVQNRRTGGGKNFR